MRGKKSVLTLASVPRKESIKNYLGLASVEVSTAGTGGVGMGVGVGVGEGEGEDGRSPVRSLSGISNRARIGARRDQERSGN